ncbi:hypothetical protein KIL84_020534 [Mauremys mutica]|uniref:Uncharacterized protein n=1 Tax=Mauremys mutica TaxID=74926 RepID=A0A9D4BBM1_9SAUR|nr:hypothetical protein KIL84_020534 [Mauremys mutica]
MCDSVQNLSVTLGSLARKSLDSASCTALVIHGLYHCPSKKQKNTTCAEVIIRDYISELSCGFSPTHDFASPKLLQGIKRSGDTIACILVTPSIHMFYRYVNIPLTALLR